MATTSPPPLPAPSAATAVVGVIGDPVRHSLSPLLHNAAFAALGIDWVSVGFEVADGAAAEALVGARALGLRGLSVTMPHKGPVAAVVDHRSPRAERLGAVNCVTNDDGVLHGENTDGPGLVAALRRGAAFDPEGRICLVAGAGGAARAVIAALADYGAAEVVVVNRTPSRAEEAAALAGPVGRVGEAREAVRCDLVVNATPVGMAGVPEGGPLPGDDPRGGVDEEPPGDPGDRWTVDPALLGPDQVVVDLVYHPAVTPWLAAATERGARTHNGLGMLVHQAALQLERWTGLDVPVDAMWRALLGGTPG